MWKYKRCEQDLMGTAEENSQDWLIFRENKLENSHDIWMSLGEKT